MEFVDTHCHLDVAEFDPDRDEVLARCRAQGVNRLIVPGIDAAGWPGLLTLCRRHPALFPALGLHPLYIDRHTDGDVETLHRLVKQQRPVAIGECGLDFHVDGLDRQRQQSLFEQQLQLAQDVQLPVIIHARKAHDPILHTLKHFRLTGGTIHAFNGSLQQAERYLEHGFRLGFGGTLTYPQSRRIRHLAASLPLSAIVLETDAPDMTVGQHRGERNSPEYLPLCAAALAQVRDMDIAEIARITTANALDVFTLDTPWHASTT